MRPPVRLTWRSWTAGRKRPVGGPWSLAPQPPTGLDSIKAAAVASNQNQAIGNEKQSLAEAYEDGKAPT
jgi:hypothetical protein